MPHEREDFEPHYERYYVNSTIYAPKKEFNDMFGDLFGRHRVYVD